MRIAILSDIHANIIALDSVLTDARKQSVDDYWFLGDLFGYGPHPKECFERLQDIGVAPNAWMTGNHDYATSLMVKLVPYLESENIDLGRLSGADAEVVRWLVPQYDAQQVMLEHALVLNAWFAEQAADFRTRYPSWTCVLPRIYLTHGTIKASSDDWHNLLGYIIEAEPARDSFRYLHKIGEGLARIIVVGHSHLPMFWRCNVGENINAKWEIDHVLYAHSESENFKRFQLVGTKYNSSEGIELGDTEKYPVIINPGSVGQPRDKIPLSAYAILDLEQDRVYFRRVEYDIAAVQKDMRHYKDFKFPTGFIERLAKGE